MTKEQLAVKKFMLKAGQKCPDKPTIPNLKTRKLRAKLILEEALETINKGLGIEAMLYLERGNNDQRVEIDDIVFVDNHKPDLVELADGLGDSPYVGYYGTALACGIDMEPVFEEIQKSNMSKFIDGYKRKDGKWQKGLSFRPPEIASIIEKQKNEN